MHNFGFSCDECIEQDEKMALALKRRKVRCLYCQATHSEERQWTKMEVYDDDTGSLETIYLCRRHNCCWAKGPALQNRTLKKTQLLELEY